MAIRPDSPWIDAVPGDRHPGETLNISFLDGHVENIKLAELKRQAAEYMADPGSTTTVWGDRKLYRP